MKKSRERPIRRWLNEIKEKVKSLNMMIQEAIRTAKNDEQHEHGKRSRAVCDNEPTLILPLPRTQNVTLQT